MAVPLPGPPSEDLRAAPNAVIAVARPVAFTAPNRITFELGDRLYGEWKPERITVAVDDATYRMLVRDRSYVVGFSGSRRVRAPKERKIVETAPYLLRTALAAEAILEDDAAARQLFDPSRDARCRSTPADCGASLRAMLAFDAPFRARHAAAEINLRPEVLGALDKNAQQALARYVADARADSLAREALISARGAHRDVRTQDWWRAGARAVLAEPMTARADDPYRASLVLTALEAMGPAPLAAGDLELVQRWLVAPHTAAVELALALQLASDDDGTESLVSTLLSRTDLPVESRRVLERHERRAKAARRPANGARAPPVARMGDSRGSHRGDSDATV